MTLTGRNTGRCLLFLLGIFAFSQANAAANYKVPVSAKEIKIATYNVQNLFDTLHDDGKNDWTFLPKNYPGKTKACKSTSRQSECLNTSWTKARLQTKLSQIKKALAAQGSLPDLLAITEIENDNVARMLQRTLGYDQFVITDSPDKRGIDVALFYNTRKVQLINSREVTFSSSRVSFPTRNILVANFSIRGRSSAVLGVFVNHWPAQMAPNDSRMAAADYLRKAIDREKKKYGSQYHVIATGDFNVNTADMPNALSHDITNPLKKTHYVDTYDIIRRSKKTATQSTMPAGSYFYGTRLSWDRYDRFILSKNLVDKKGVDFVTSSFLVVAPKFLTSSWVVSNSRHHHNGSTIHGLPFRHNPKETSAKKVGFSDHFPIVMKIKF